MGKDTSIQWAHSTLNLQSGCDGCELWNTKRRICYAGVSIRDKYAGRKGWPDSFEEPKLFLERLPEALRWGAPTQREMDLKPWIPAGFPRVIFLNDMGDTFSKKLPLNWMGAILPHLKTSPHQFLLLTKRPSRLLQFSERFPIPKNVWLGTSITGPETAGRADILRRVKTGGPKFLSCEPIWGMLPESTFAGMQWVIFGGESGQEPNQTDMGWIRQGIVDATIAGAKVFVKQLGAAPIEGGKLIELKDGHGGDWDEWTGPLAPLRIRTFPEILRDELDFAA